MSSTVQTIRLLPPYPVRAGDYDVDAVAIEHNADADAFDFRLELGSGLGIYWALPAAPNDRLRLVLVDAAAWTVDEPELVTDPWVAGVSLVWSGALGTLSDGRVLQSVQLDVMTTPGAYRCVLETVAATSGERRTVALAWRERPPGS